MGITSDGWLDWAIRLPGPDYPIRRPEGQAHTNVGINGDIGLFMHSAEGYASVLLDPASIYGYRGNHSWHLSNLFDGRVFQHYPFTTRCWHASKANQMYIGVENEGHSPKDPTLTAAQIESAKRFIKEISEWKGWEPRRPYNDTETGYTLWEHREVVKLGGTATACPSGRIPWDKILMEEDVSPEEEKELAHRRAKAILDYNTATQYHLKYTDGTLSAIELLTLDDQPTGIIIPVVHPDERI